MEKNSEFEIHNVEKTVLFDSSVTTIPIYFCIHDPTNNNLINILYDRFPLTILLH